MANHRRGWETHIVNIFTLNTVRHLGLILEYLIVTVYTQCCLIIRRDVCIHLLNVRSKVFINYTRHFFLVLLTGIKIHSILINICQLQSIRSHPTYFVDNTKQC